MNYRILYLLITLTLFVLGCLLWVSSDGVVHAAEPFDIDKLAHAVAVAETSNCTKGVGKSKNNCHGINACKGYCIYSSTTDSFTAFKSIWLRKYGARFPTWNDALKYTNGNDTKHWMYNVTRIYNR